MLKTKEQILKYFKYNKDKGELYWKYHPHPATLTKVLNKRAGSKVECKNKTSYLNTCVEGKCYYVHVLIFIIEKGYRPFQIDHIDGNGLNNKIENLKACKNQSQNMINKTMHRNGKLPWNYFCKDTNRYRSIVNINGKRKCLGRHDTEEQAHIVSKSYLKARGLCE